MNLWLYSHFPGVWGRWWSARILATTLCSGWLHAANPDFTMWQRLKRNALCTVLFAAPFKLPLQIHKQQEKLSMNTGLNAVHTIQNQPRLRPTQALANALIKQLVASGAENYQEDHFEFTIDGESVERPVVVTISFRDRPSPHELRLQAESERDSIAALAKQREEDWRNLVEKLVFELEEANKSHREMCGESVARSDAEAGMSKDTDELLSAARAMLTVETL